MNLKNIVRDLQKYSTESGIDNVLINLQSENPSFSFCISNIKNVDEDIAYELLNYTIDNINSPYDDLYDLISMIHSEYSDVNLVHKIIYKALEIKQNPFLLAEYTDFVLRELNDKKFAREIIYRTLDNTEKRPELFDSAKSFHKNNNEENRTKFLESILHGHDYYSLATFASIVAADDGLGDKLLGKKLVNEALPHVFSFEDLRDLIEIAIKDINDKDLAKHILYEGALNGIDLDQETLTKLKELIEKQSPAEFWKKELQIVLNKLKIHEGQHIHF